MDGLRERDSAVVAFYIDRIEADFDARLARIRHLGAWAAGLMELSSSDETTYQDILYRLAIAGAEDRIVIDRVRDDLAAACISVSRERVHDKLAREVTTY